MNRILIAEDEPHIVRFLVKGLQAQGYTTAHAADGNQALLLARTGQFDLLLLDLGLPGRDGLDVLASCARAGPASGHRAYRPQRPGRHRGRPGRRRRRLHGQTVPPG